MESFSVCIIAKNEELYIERCLKSLLNFDCEIIIVDTGSTDHTKEIAKIYTQKIFDFNWIDDFSAARNYSITQASNDWILVLDCDEWVKECSPEIFIPLAEKHPDHLGIIEIINLLPTGNYVDKIPRFFNRKYFHYKGTIHEQLVSLNSSRLKGFEMPLTIFHSGYNVDSAKAFEKHNRNMHLLKLELEKDRNNPYLLFQMGQEYYNQSDYTSALSYFEKVIGYKLPSSLEYIRVAIQSYGECLLELNRIDEALSLEQYSKDFGDIPDYRYLMGRIYLAANRPLDAMTEFIRAVSLDHPRSSGTNSYLSWYHIALINESLGDLKSAKMFYEKCGDFQPAKEKLIELNTNS